MPRSEPQILLTAATGCSVGELHLADLQFKVRRADAARGHRDDLVGRWAESLGSVLFPDDWPEAAGWRRLLGETLVVVSDDVMHHMSLSATEIRPRIRRERDGTAAAKAFWYEELVPELSLFWSAWSLQPRARAKIFKPDQMKNALDWAMGAQTFGVPPPPSQLRLGGLRSTGKGRLAWRQIAPLHAAPVERSVE